MTENSTKYFSIKNISKTWKSPCDFSVNFDAEIEKGKTLGILGKSGSGKSTVLRLIAGLIENDKNPEKKPEIILDGKNITEEKPSSREIGMVFQNHSLFPHLTVLENVAYGLRFSKIRKNLSKKEAQEKAFDFLKIFELQKLSDRYPETLSGGEAQRVSLARSLILKPKAILFDEPFSSLDKPMSRKLISDIKLMQEKERFSAILVTHSIDEAQMLCDTIAVLRKGKKIWNGKSEDFTESLLNTEI